MSKAKKQAGRRASSTEGDKRKQSAATSPLIPAVVGLVMVIVVLGIVLSLDSWRSAPTVDAADPTALPMATRQIPYPGVARMSVQEAREKLAQGEIVMVDVRSTASYDSLHIEGAISVPESEIENRLDELDTKRTLVLYCT